MQPSRRPRGPASQDLHQPGPEQAGSPPRAAAAAAAAAAVAAGGSPAGLTAQCAPLPALPAQAPTEHSSRAATAEVSAPTSAKSTSRCGCCGACPKALEKAQGAREACRPGRRTLRVLWLELRQHHQQHAQTGPLAPGRSGMRTDWHDCSMLSAYSAIICHSEAVHAGIAVRERSMGDGRALTSRCLTPLIPALHADLLQPCRQRAPQPRSGSSTAARLPTQQPRVHRPCTPQLPGRGSAARLARYCQGHQAAGTAGCREPTSGRAAKRSRRLLAAVRDDRQAMTRARVSLGARTSGGRQ